MLSLPDYKEKQLVLINILEGKKIKFKNAKRYLIFY